MARGPQFPRRKKWADVLDSAKADEGRLRGSARTWAEPYWIALSSVREELGRRRRDYFTDDDAQLVQKRAYPKL